MPTNPAELNPILAYACCQMSVPSPFGMRRASVPVSGVRKMPMNWLALPTQTARVMPFSLLTPVKAIVENDIDLLHLVSADVSGTS